MSLEETIKQDYAALKAKIEAEFDALIKKVDGLFGINNSITPHIQATKASALAHVDAGAPGEETPTVPNVSAPAAAASQEETKPPQDDDGNAGNGADVAAQKGQQETPAATGDQSTGE